MTTLNQVQNEASNFTGVSKTVKSIATLIFIVLISALIVDFALDFHKAFQTAQTRCLMK